MDHQTLSHLIGLIYDAALDADKWPRLLKALSDELCPDADGMHQADQLSNDDLVDLLCVHFAHALKLNRELNRTREERAATETLLGLLPLKMIVVDSECRVLAASDEWSDMVPEGKWISVRNDLLSAGSSDDTTRLRELIRAVADNGKPEGKAIHLSDPNMTAPISALAIPLRSNTEAAPNGKKKVAVLVAAPPAQTEISAETLRSLYRLSGAEAKLVSALVRNCSLNSIVAEFGVSIHTIRNQLKSVYEKTGTHSQAELVRDVITGPAMLAAFTLKNHSTVRFSTASTPSRNAAKAESRLHQTLTLPDGNRLGYAEYGAPDGRAVMLMHSVGGSRLERHPDETIVERCGIRLIVPERPGVGLSDGKRNTTLLNWARNVDRLADHLRLQEFSVIGWSFGAAFALASAHQLNNRIARLVTVSGIVPFDSVWELGGMYAPFRLFLSLGKYTHAVLEPMMELISSQATAELYQREVRRSLSPMDRVLLDDVAISEMLMEDTRENFRQRGCHILSEMITISKSWGFALEDIAVPTEVWHGEADRIVPLKMAKRSAERLRHCRTHFVPGAGHFLLLHCWRQILLSALAEDDLHQNPST